MKIYLVQFPNGNIKNKAYMNIGHAKLGARQTKGSVVLEIEGVIKKRYVPSNKTKDHKSEWFEEDYTVSELEERLKLML